MSAPVASPSSTSLRRRLLELLAPEGAAADLAMLRITVVMVLLLSTSITSAEHWAALPAAARTAPLGVGWLVPLLRMDVETVLAVRWVFRIAGGLALLGAFTRPALVVVTVTSFYLLLVPQLGGAVFHDHHLLWLAAILAASPCGDALSVDAWLARRRGQRLPTRGRAHGAAVRCAWLVIGLVFLFPGVHKLAESGVAWALSDNLRNQMWWKWAQDPALLPSLRIDRHPFICRGLATLTILFELSFLPMVFHPRTRAIAVAGALAFHAGAEVFMGIQFSVLWACYGMFVPWERLATWAAGHARVGPSARNADLDVPARSLIPLSSVAGPVLAGVVLFGAAGAMQAYPFACYPTFQWMAADHMPAMLVEVEDGAGARRILDRALTQEPGPRGWALAWRLVGVYGAVRPDAIEAWLDDARAREPLRSALSGAVTVRVLRAEISVDPDRPPEILSRREVWSAAR